MHHRTVVSFWLFSLERALGHGAFGQVCFAKVIGIEAFNPRRTLEEKSKQWFLSVMLNRKHYSYVNCSNIKEAAVKMLNGKLCNPGAGCIKK